MIKKHQFSHNDVRIESSKTLFSGFFEIAELVVRHKLFNGSWSQPIKREIFQRGEAVGVLLFDPANQLVGLVEQFRVGRIAIVVARPQVSELSASMAGASWL